MARLSIVLLFWGLAGCQSFLVAPSPHQPGPPLAAARKPSSASRVSSLPRHRGPPSFRRASDRPSPESLSEARQRLIASAEYDQLVDRVDGRSPFAEAGYAQEQADAEALGAVRGLLRFVVDVGIVLVPVALCVSSGVLPAALLAPFGSAAAAIKGSAVEPMLQALPWDLATVLRAAAEGGVAISLSPLTDRLVVAPAIHQWAQARLRAVSK